MPKSISQHLMAIAAFGFFTVLYFLPYYQGKVLNQHDIIQYNGMSKEITDWNEKHPEEPALWTNRMFGGMPAFQIAMSYPSNLIHKISELAGKFFPEATSSLFWLMAGFYLLLVTFNAPPLLAAAGAVAYALCSFNILSIEAGHNTKVLAMGFMAPTLAGVVRAWKGQFLQGAAITALFLSLCIDANHLQITYYLFLCIGFTGLFFLVQCVRDKNWKTFLSGSTVVVMSCLLALLPNLTNLWSTYEYQKETIRGGTSELSAKKAATTGGGLDFDYATRWSYGLMDGEILTLLIPNIKGGGTGSPLPESSASYTALVNQGVPPQQASQYLRQMPTYWGSQPFTSGPVYFGAVLMGLFFLGLIAWNNPIRWAMLAVSLLGMFLAFGFHTPVYKLAFELFPFFNKFRNPSMALAIPQLFFPLIGIMGWYSLTQAKSGDPEMEKKLKIAAGIGLGTVGVFGLLGSFMSSFTGTVDQQLISNNQQWMVDALRADRASMLRSDAIRSIFFIGLSFGAAWMCLKGKLSSTVATAAIGLLAIADNWMVDSRYLSSEDYVEKMSYNQNYSPTAADLEILKDSDPNYRVFNLSRDPFNDAMTSYYHKSVGGYHAAKLIRYQDLIENQISKNNMNVLNMLNTRYFIMEDPQTKQPVARRNPGALGNAWLLNEIKWVKSADEEMNALSNFNPASELIADERFKTLAAGNFSPPDSSAFIRQTSYSPNQLSYEYQSNSASVAVFSEIYYNEEKGWKAYLDGKEVPHFRANYVLRAMALPAGSHRIEFRFEPKSYVLGNQLSLAGSALIYLLLFGSLGLAWKQQQKNNSTTAEAKAPAKSQKA